jgi:AcrR family transcriptional regulator
MVANSRVLARRAKHKESLRRGILEAAGELFAREGYENVSMRKIAEKIEYSPTAIYLYFRDKAELLNSLCEEMFQGLCAKLAQLEREGRDPVDALKRGCRTYIEFGLAHPNHYRVIFMMPRQGYSPSEQVQSAGMGAFEHLCRAVHRCIEAGCFRDRDTMAASQVLWSAIHGLTSLLITDANCELTEGRFPWLEHERLIGMLVDTMVGGLLE